MYNCLFSLITERKSTTTTKTGLDRGRVWVVSIEYKRRKKKKKGKKKKKKKAADDKINKNGIIGRKKKEKKNTKKTTKKKRLFLLHPLFSISVQQKYQIQSQE